MTTVGSIYSFIDSVAPFSEQCEWDNAGLLVGDKDIPVTKALVCLDLTLDALKAATDEGCNLVITHHPIIFSPLKSISFDDVVSKLCTNSISVISAHTNYDKATGGVNDILCQIMGIKNVVSFGEDSLARMGELESEMTDKEFAEFVGNKLNTAVKYVATQKKIKKVALCGGAGADYMYTAIQMGVDALITADTKHHELLYSRDNGFCLVDAGHYSTENPAMEVLCDRLKENFAEVDFVLYKGNDPVNYLI
ncbi:MAG: Nif3-like dinuclear metal center hexameric protein [Clostridia bacterium]|nr:Nif3-like dinuclear metal center hexameric protein [Clostridia bacterium]